MGTEKYLLLLKEKKFPSAMKERAERSEFSAVCRIFTIMDQICKAKRHFYINLGDEY